MDGHHRVAAAIELGIESVPVRQINMQEFKILAERFRRFSTPEALKAISEGVKGKPDVKGKR